MERRREKFENERFHVSAVARDAIKGRPPVMAVSTRPISFIRMKTKETINAYVVCAIVGIIVSSILNCRVLITFFRRLVWSISITLRFFKLSTNTFTSLTS